QVFVIEPTAGDRVEMLVREHQGRVAGLQPDIGRISGHRLLGEIHDEHGVLPVQASSLRKWESKATAPRLPWPPPRTWSGDHAGVTVKWKRRSPNFSVNSVR